MNPLRLIFTSVLWRAAGFLIADIVVGWVLFTVIVGAVTTAWAMTITIIGIPLLIACAGIVKGCAAVQRARTGGGRKTYRQPAEGTGLLAAARVRWGDSGLWRDISALTVVWLPLSVLNTVVLSLWAMFLGWITTPIWYHYPWMTYHGVRYHGYQMCCYFPHGPYGPGAIGVFVGSLHVALAAAGAGLVGFVIMSYAVLGCARLTKKVLGSLLRDPADPLTDVKAVLTQPGPLSHS
jgi:hypothetical protein